MEKAIDEAKELIFTYGAETAIDGVNFRIHDINADLKTCYYWITIKKQINRLRALANER